MKITQSLVEDLVAEVAPKVEELTEWSAYLESLSIEALGWEKAWHEIFIPELESRGIDTIPKTLAGKRRKYVFKETLFQGAVGFHMESTGNIYIINDNFPKINKDQLAPMVGHELVHRCQFKNNQKFSELCHYFSKEYKGENYFDQDLSEDYNDLVFRNFMRLQEGHATFVQIELQKDYPPSELYLPKSIENALMDVQRLNPDNMGTYIAELFDVYQSGERIIRNVFHQGGNDAIKELYKRDKVGFLRSPFDRF